MGSNTVKFEAVATVGKYKDASGAEKSRFVRVGTVFESDKGMSLKLDSIPAGNEWNGWISFYPPKDKQASGQQASTAQAQQRGMEPDGDIPF